MLHAAYRPADVRCRCALLTLLVGAAVCVVVSGCSLRSPPPIHGVSVRHPGDSRKTLSGPELAEFAACWNAKTPIDARAGDGGGEQLGLDIDFGDGDERWIYYTSGRATRLSMKQMTVYEVRDPEKFNHLIGAASSDAPQPSPTAR